MSLPRVAFCLGHYGLSALSLLAGYHTPVRLRFIYVLIHIAYFLGVFYYIPSRHDETDYIWGTVGFFMILKNSDWFLLSSPYTDFFRLGGQKYADLSTSGRINWALNHAVMHRGIGWSWQVPYLQPGPSPTASRFNFLKKFLVFYLLNDISNFYLMKNTYLRTGGAEGSRLTDLPFLQKSLLGWAGCLLVIFKLNGPITLLMMCAIGIWGTADEARPMLGKWEDCYTIRRFWGRVWHQLLRRPLQSHGRWLAWRVFGFRRGSNGSNYTQVYLAFFLCAVGHWVANMAMNSSKSSLVTLWFFVSQAVAITGEDIVIWAAKKLGVGKPKEEKGTTDVGMWRYVGYCWVAMWFSVMMPQFLENHAEVGMLKEAPGVSLVQGFLDGRWVVG
ncbi:membrane bound O-acyl transferase family-domain-containing protein [Trichophaea hybrida]|nr:membrane bound O-acyl transferase family-domain-containing protein [Trichophaea hybrida]